MSIKEPTTYGEWYWAQGFQAALAEQESYEQELAPVISSVINGLNIPEFLPASLTPLFSAIQAPAAPAWGAIIGRFGSEVADSVVGQASKHALMDFNYKMAEWFGDLRLDARTASLLWWRKKVTEEMYDSRMATEGYKPAEAAAFYESLQPYPTVPEVMLWARYHGDPDNIRETAWKRADISTLDFDLWEWLGLQRLTTLQVQTLFKRGRMTDSEAATELARLGWSKDDRDTVRDLCYTVPNAMLLTQGNLQLGATQDAIVADISRGDIHPDYALKYLNAILTKPPNQDIIAYELRKDPSLAGLEEQLRKIGIHPDYRPLYHELAHIIPPVADIITMAVREAFTPSIAARFGQYEDFPPDLAKYAAQKGLTEEWAKRYWAAHWSLPSPLQGFQMLHRGVIDETELNMLLRAQDVMPFWRDKLTQIAYRPLTRVDVRRMYKQGVLDEGEVFESYLDQGYNEENAERMAEFTVKQTLASLSKFTSNDIIKAFAGRMISAGDARSLLNTIGIRNEDATYIISTAEYKRKWAFTDQQISGIRNLYKKKVYDENDTRSHLAGLNLPSDQIEVLMEQWYYEVKDEPTATWTTAQTLSFVRKGLITRDRAERELYLNGYDEEHVTIYMKSIA